MSQSDHRDGEATIALLARLVAARSPNPPGDERPVADVIRDAARELGLPEPECHARTPERPNLLIRIGSGSPTLMLAAHTDTVPPVDHDAWTTDPYSLTRADDDRLIGLGAADMKGSVAAMLQAAGRIVADPPPHGSVVFAFTADEEEGSNEGVLWMRDEGLLQADAAVLTEPCSMSDESWDALYVAHRGSFAVRLVAHGKAGHSGEQVDPAERASLPFARALTALCETDVFAARSFDLDGTRPLLNVATTISGGHTAWAHPGTLEATLEVRTIPGMTEAGVLQDLRAVLDAAGVSDRVVLETVDWCPPATEVRDERLLGAARHAWESVLGRTPRVACLPASTDASRIEAAGIPTIPNFGPGSLKHVHQPGEWLTAADLARSVDLFEALIRRYLADPPA